MFRTSQRFYDAMYAWKDYPSEVERLERRIRERNPSARTLLDVAYGTGKHLELLRHRYRVEGLDLDPETLTIARERLGPDVPLHLGDLEGFNLGRQFDVVTCLFSSIAYMRTTERLQAAIGTMARHVGSGWAPDRGALLHAGPVGAGAPGLDQSSTSRTSRWFGCRSPVRPRAR